MLHFCALSWDVHILIMVNVGLCLLRGFFVRTEANTLLDVFNLSDLIEIMGISCQ